MWYFNSTMVRLEEHLPFFNFSSTVNFNSTMVRLEDVDEKNSVLRIQISIPRWYD